MQGAGTHRVYPGAADALRGQEVAVVKAVAAAASAMVAMV
jgi:hypothetical protein